MWKIKWDPSVKKEMRKLDKGIVKKIARYMEERVAKQEDPRVFGKGLQYHLNGLWRYRVEDYRIICRIRDEEIEILVVEVGHRRDVYFE